MTMPTGQSDTARRFLAIVQDPRGYPPNSEPLPADLPAPVVHQVVLADDYERLLREVQNGDGPCGLCGGYGAFNPGKQEPVPCIACGKKSDGLVLVAVEDVVRPRIATDGQWRGLRLVEGDNAAMSDSRTPPDNPPPPPEPGIENVARSPAVDVAALAAERDRLRWQVDGLIRHRDGCVAKLEAIRAEVELEQRVGAGASIAGKVLAILNRNPTP